jgi:hypothetical protein
MTFQVYISQNFPHNFHFLSWAQMTFSAFWNPEIISVMYIHLSNDLIKFHILSIRRTIIGGKGNEREPCLPLYSISGACVCAWEHEINKVKIAAWPAITLANFSAIINQLHCERGCIIALDKLREVPGEGNVQTLKIFLKIFLVEFWKIQLNSTYLFISKCSYLPLHSHPDVQ